MPRRPRLIDVTRRPRPTSTCTDLVAFDPTRCPSCGALTVEVGASQQSLLRHGGYGADTGHQRRSCRCGWGLDVGSTSTNPRWR